MGKTIAFFDFDGTLTYRDSFLEFIKFAVGLPHFYAGMVALSPMLVLYKLGVVPNHQAKIKVLRHFFKSEEAFKQKAGAFNDKIPSLLKEVAYKKLKWHQESGHEVVVVSASAGCWLEGWCKNESVELISTQIGFEKGKPFYKTMNCFGPQKAIRIQERFDLGIFEKIYAYGDSRGDKEMLELADERFYRTF